jgi:hypothetical protein
MGDYVDRAAVQSAVRAYLALEDTDAAWEVERIIAALPPAPDAVEALVKAAAQTLLDDLARAIPGNGDLGDPAAGRRWAKASDAAETAPTMVSRPTPIQMIRAALAAIRTGGKP